MPSIVKPAPKKRKAIISSDEEDDDPKPKTNKSVTPKHNLKKLKKTSTDDDDIKSKTARGKPVDVCAAFGAENITRVERPKSKSKKAAADELASHFDEAFDDSLAEIDSSLLEVSPVSAKKSKVVQVETNGSTYNHDIKSVKSEKPAQRSPNNGEHSRKTKEQVDVKAEITSPAKMKTPAAVSAKKTPKSRKRSAETADTLNETGMHYTKYC